jgi:tetratricopeptide (TPR) repeat protein
MFKGHNISLLKRYIIAAVALLCLCFSLFAQNTDDYQRTATKANRFFENREWLNANAMYWLMLDQRPREVSTYSHAIVSNIMAGDTVSMATLLEQSMTNNVPFDSLLFSVQNVSMQVGSSDLYEKVLLTSRQHFNWLARGIDAYLLKYYDFRNNGPKIIEYAKIMLNGMPESIEFKRLLARGYSLNNEMELAAQTWKSILQINPYEYDTLVDLGNYYEVIGQHATACSFLTRAYAIRKTPYLKSLLSPSNTKSE